MSQFDVDAMLQRFQERAAAVKERPLPPVAGDERKLFIEQAETRLHRLRSGRQRHLECRGQPPRAPDPPQRRIDARQATADRLGKGRRRKVGGDRRPGVVGPTSRPKGAGDGDGITGWPLRPFRHRGTGFPTPRSQTRSSCYADGPHRCPPRVPVDQLNIKGVHGFGPLPGPSTPWPPPPPGSGRSSPSGRRSGRSKKTAGTSSSPTPRQPVRSGRTSGPHAPSPSWSPAGRSEPRRT